MKRFKKYWFYLLLALSISLTVMVINDINDQLIPKIIQDINSGVIGAILTTIITLILLSNQTESQENLTKSSVVYEEKLKIFNSFLDTIGTSLEDGKLTAQEVSKIIQSFSILRMHVSIENALKLEKTISTIDNSLFYHDENSLPNIDQLVALYTDLSNVFQDELYGEKAESNLKIFDVENFKRILYRPRESPIKPNDFMGLIFELKNNPQFLHTGTTTKKTIYFAIDDELTESLIKFNDFMEKILGEISDEIIFKYEIKKKIINNKTYCGIPWINLYYKNVYFAFFGMSETKRLFVGKNFPEKEQVASLEIFEIDSIQTLKMQITSELKNIITSIDKKNNI
jgi:hypothetical protein